MEFPKLLTGDIRTDDRGDVGFVNEFEFAGVKRFYSVANHRAGFIRAWHAHRREAKYVTVVCGAALVGAVAVDNWEKPSKAAKIHRYVLSAHKPSVLYIPAAYANGFMSLTENAKLLFFSTSTLNESMGDDVRYEARYWDIWSIEER